VNEDAMPIFMKIDGIDAAVEPSGAGAPPPIDIHDAVAFVHGGFGSENPDVWSVAGEGDPSATASGHRLFVGNLSYHYGDPLEPDGIVNYSSGDALTHEYVVTSIAHAATGNNPVDVPEFVDDAVGPSTSGGQSLLEFSVENFPNNTSGDGSTNGFGLDRGHLSRSFDRTHTETIELIGVNAHYDYDLII
jgi:hypothetical protein